MTEEEYDAYIHLVDFGIHREMFEVISDDEDIVEEDEHMFI